MAAVPLPRSSPAPRSCPGCGRRPGSVVERRVLADELVTTWLLVEGGPVGGTVVVRSFCRACVPGGPVAALQLPVGWCGAGGVGGGEGVEASGGVAARVPYGRVSHTSSDPHVANEPALRTASESDAIARSPRGTPRVGRAVVSRERPQVR